MRRSLHLMKQAQAYKNFSTLNKMRKTNEKMNFAMPNLFNKDSRKEEWTQKMKLQREQWINNVLFFFNRIFPRAFFINVKFIRFSPTAKKYFDFQAKIHNFCQVSKALKIVKRLYHSLFVNILRTPIPLSQVDFRSKSK